MIPKAYYPIFVLLFTCLPMTAGNVSTSSVKEAFNVSLKDATGKSTPIGLPMETSSVNLPLSIEPSSSALQKVVIDAGHGGKDPGGMGDNSHEKHIALKIAQLLVAL